MSHVVIHFIIFNLTHSWFLICTLINFLLLNKYNNIQEELQIVYFFY